MLTFDNDFTDIGHNNGSWVLDSAWGDIKIQHDVYKFGTGACLFHPTYTDHHSYIISASNIDCLRYGTEWTIDWWENRLSTFPIPDQTYLPTTWELGSHSNYDNELLLISHRTLPLLYYTQSTNLSLSGTNNVIDPTPTYDTWNHMAVCRKNDTWYLFKNGHLSNSVVENLNLGSQDFLAIGTNILPKMNQRPDRGYYHFHGYIDMFRISNVCRWTTDFDCNNIKYYK